MSPKYRMTGCARTFIFLLILIPIAYFVASYATGTNPIEQITGVIEKFKGEEGESRENAELESGNQDETLGLQELLEEKDAEIEKLRERISELEEELNSQNTN